MLSERRQVLLEPTARSRCGPDSHGMTARRQFLQGMVVYAGFALGFLSATFAIVFGIPILLPKFEGSQGVGLSPSTIVCLGACTSWPSASALVAGS